MTIEWNDRDGWDEGGFDLWMSLKSTLKKVYLFSSEARDYSLVRVCEF